MSIHQVSAQAGALPMTFETGKMARLADGAVTVTMGETMVLVSAVSLRDVREGQDWFPLSVEYKEKATAAGVFPGGYFKREGRPSEKEILTCRMTDRPLRPLFPKGYFYDTQIISLLLSADGENDADILSINGASAALCVSDFPFAGPVAAVRLGRIDDQWVINPTNEQREISDLDLVYCGKNDGVIMIEGSAEILPDELFSEALSVAQEAIQPLLQAQEELRSTAGKATRSYETRLPTGELMTLAREILGERLDSAIQAATRHERDLAVGALQKEVAQAAKEKFEGIEDFDISQAFDTLQKEAFRRCIMEKGIRADGRELLQLRTLSAEHGLIPRVHGSALFARGETQALALTTLAPSDEQQFFDSYTGGADSKRFLLHYNFPPFSVGETGRFGGQNRREIGHGALAERSVLPVIPDAADFPYAIRVSSEVMESNGSTSMASVCSGVLALYDAGVPLKAPVSGISVGLVTEYDEEGNIARHKPILDIIGSEDFFGDMDFKLCGTAEGVTGFQLDLKLPGIPLSILQEAVEIARKGRCDVLEVMNKCIQEPAELSQHAPRIVTIQIPSDRIGELIGPSGKNIKAIQAESGAEINIEDDGTVNIYSASQEGAECAKQLIEVMFKEAEVGVDYTGKIMSTTKFGAFMQIFPGKDGLIHISELASGRVERTEDVVKEGDIVTARCLEIDNRGRVRMSLRAVLEDQANQEQDS